MADMQAVAAGGAAGQAWEQMLHFLEKNLKADGTSLSPAQTGSRVAIFNWRYYLVLAFEHAFGTASHHN